MIPYLTHYQKRLIPQILISLIISAWWLLHPPYWDDPFRVLSFSMLLYSFFCGYLFVYYDPLEEKANV